MLSRYCLPVRIMVALSLGSEDGLRDGIGAAGIDQAADAGLVGAPGLQHAAEEDLVRAGRDLAIQCAGEGCDRVVEAPAARGSLPLGTAEVVGPEALRAPCEHVGEMALLRRQDVDAEAA